MTDTTQHRDAARPPPGAYPVPGAIGPMASVEVTVSDIPPEEVSADRVELRLVAFLRKLRAEERDRRLERLRTDGRTAVETFRDWAGLGHPSSFVRRVRRIVRERMRRSGSPEDGDPVRPLQDGDVFARLEDHIGSRPLLTPADHARIGRRAKACADRRNPDGTVDADAVERRLVDFLERLRAGDRDRQLERLRTDGRAAVEMLRDWTGLNGGHPMWAHGDAPPLDDDGPDAVDFREDGDDLAWLLEEEDVFARLEGYVERRPLLTPRDHTRIKRRAKACADRCNAILNDALAGLCKNSEDTERVRKRLLRLAGPVPAVVVRDGAQADAIAAELHGAMPWMGPGHRERLARIAAFGAVRDAGAHRQDLLGAPARGGPGRPLRGTGRLQGPSLLLADRDGARLGDGRSIP